MPAIQPARLKIQLAELRDSFQQPNIGVQRLRDFFSRYGNRLQRSGQARVPQRTLDTYDVPPPVLQGVMAELQSLAEWQPDIALDLAVLLWADTYWEFRRLAAYLIGQLRGTQSIKIINIVDEWYFSTPDPDLGRLVMDSGLSGLRSNSPDILLEWAERLLADQRKLSPKAALTILIGLANDPEFNNLPAIFRLISPMLRSADKSVRPELIDLLVKLIERSPGEAAFALKQGLHAQDKPDTAWIIRQVLGKFPIEIQSGLKIELQSLHTS